MRNRSFFMLAAAAALASAAARADDEPGLQAVAALARINGQALACQEADAARRAKALMLAHAPKTPRYAAVYEEGTQAAYLRTTRGEAACPDAAALAARLDAVARQLRAALPAAGGS